MNASNDEQKKTPPERPERSYELRSEKVRSIVGQIPSSLVRYGIAIIGIVLVVLFVVAYFLPYKKVYSGQTVIYSIPTNYQKDSIDLELKLLFEVDRPKTSSYHSDIVFGSSQDLISGKLIELNSLRDTTGRQHAVCEVLYTDAKKIVGQTLDFQLIVESSSLLVKMLGGK